MARKNVAASIEKWKKNMAASGEAMKAGILATTESPTQKAAAAQDKYAAGVNEAVSSGRYARNLQAVTLQDWQSAASTKGVTNMTNGVRSLTPRAQRGMQDQMAYAQTVSDQVQGMPNTTESDADQRMLAAVNAMRAYKKNK